MLTWLRLSIENYPLEYWGFSAVVQGFSLPEIKFLFGHAICYSSMVILYFVRAKTETSNVKIFS